MTMPELIHLLEEAVKLEEQGRLQDAYVLYVQIDNDINCSKSLKMTTERAMNRLTKNQQLNEKKNLVLEAANFLANEGTPYDSPIALKKTLKAFKGDTATLTEEVKESKPSSKDNIFNVDVFALESIPQIEDKMPIKQEDYDRIKEGIKKRGIINPLIALPNLKLVCGYNRLKIAKELELKTVPVIFKDIPADKIVEYAMKDNIERRQLSTDQIAEYVVSVPAQGTGRPKKNSRDKTNEDIASTLGISKRTVQRARKFAEKVKENPQLKGQSIRSVIEGNEPINRFTTKLEYTIGIGDPVKEIVDDYGETINKIFDLDPQNGDKIKIITQVYLRKR